MRDRIWTTAAKAPGRPPVRAGAGFTLIEIMVTLAVLGVLVTVAAPSITKLIQDSRIRTQANDLMASLAIARSESAKQGVRVTVCASTTYTSTTPSCTGGTAWNSGYILFTDVNADGNFDAGTDTVLRIGEPLTGGNTLVSNGFTAPPAGSVQYRPSGNTNVVPATPATFKLCDSRTGPFGRLITVFATGRTISVFVIC